MRVSFSDSAPSEKEYFEEYANYNKSLWFGLIFILRTLIPFCTALQISPFEDPVVIDFYFQMSSTSTKYGRRSVLLCFCFIWNASGWVLVFLTNTDLFNVLYMINTISSSIVLVVSFVTFAEISNRHSKILSIYTNMSHMLGQITMDYVANTLCVWKYILIYIATANSLVLFACWYIPESPRWLLNKDKKAQAYDQLNDISGMLYNIKRSSIESNTSARSISVLYKMFKYLFTKKLKYFVIICWSMFITSLNYNCARKPVAEQIIINNNYPEIVEMKTILYYAGTKEFCLLAISASAMGYLFLIPVYIFLGKRHGLMFMFMLIAAQYLVGLFTSSTDHESYHNIFGLLFGITATSLNFLYFLDLFPTFLRATTVGTASSIFGMTLGFSTFITKSRTDRKDFSYYLSSLIFQLLGSFVLLLPDLNNHELSNYKLQ